MQAPQCRKHYQTQVQQELSEQLKILVNRYLLYCLQKKKVKQIQLFCLPRFRRCFYKSAKWMWQKIIPKFVYKLPVQLEYFWGYLCQKKYQTVVNFDKKFCQKVFQCRPIQKILQESKHCIVLIYEKQNLPLIIKMLNNKKLAEISQKYGQKIGLIEIQDTRNLQWKQKLAQLNLQNDRKIKQNDFEELILEQEATIQPLKLLKFQNTHCDTQKNKQNISVSDFQRSNRKLINDKNPLNETNKDNQPKNISILLPATNSIQDVNLKLKKKKFSYPLIGSLWRGLFDELQLLEWFSVSQQDDFKLIVDEIKSVINFQEQKEEIIIQSASKLQREKLNNKVYQTQKSLLETHQK